jgi:SAM-dependent methyltransferase
MLDYGGAAGWHSIAFSRLGLAVTYFEPRADLADFASWRFQARNLTISQDFNPVASGKRFDIICCFDFLPVVPDPVEVVAELHSLLNQDGILFLTPGLQPTNGLATDAIAMLTALGLRRAISVGYMDVFVRDAPVYYSIQPLTVKEEACAVLRRRMSLMPAA